ncbi:plasmid mobilization protein [Flavisolibacter nicotianae]|uniref:plasmid mobilization protein n=1 Tax=Flavisolibacter nicotianae TaxID=2364882 RepID=UPI000EAD95EE|nr:plasmid mobilization relaxosome protein MobC [Flavisolibacter nicotianae]
MKAIKPVRDRWLTIRLSKGEENALLKLSRKTTCRSLSEYGRNVLLKEPVIVLFRNGSADNFLEEMVLLKKELNAIGNNFNQAVHRLHTLDKIPEIKLWILMSESQRVTLLKKTDEILQKLTQIHALWLQK